MTSVPPKVPPEENKCVTSATGVGVSGAAPTRTLLFWLAVIAVMVGGLWWLSNGDEPPSATDTAASHRAAHRDQAGSTRRSLDLSRHLDKRGGPHLFDDKRPNWDPARLRRPGVGLTRHEVADAASAP